ncbi:MAG: glutathione S-transferase C-terminal domain-containing protein [Geminicoccaceae bacterium]
MLTLYSYPDLYGLPDNNPFGLKVWAFLKLVGLTFRHEHIFDASKAPRGQLPYIVDDGETVGDSDAIIVHLISKYGLPIDAGLTQAQQDTSLKIRRVLDDLYWVMSYSRWKDPEFAPLFRAEMLKTHARLSEADMVRAAEYNSTRYWYQGIGRYEPAQVYERGLADLAVIGRLLTPGPFVFGNRAHSVDAALYGFLANIWFHEARTPLKQFMLDQRRLATFCETMREHTSE